MSFKIAFCSLLFALNGLFAAVAVDEMPPPEREVIEPKSAITSFAIEIRTSELPAALNAMDLGNDTQVIVESRHLRSLYFRLMPFADQLRTEAALRDFLSDASFGKPFIDGVLPDLARALTPMEKHGSKICDCALKMIFGNNSFLELNHQLARKITSYLQQVNAGNKILGAPYWKVKYAGTIGGRHFEVGTRITDWQILRLTDEGEVREDLRKLEESLRGADLIAPESTCRFVANEDGLFADTGSALLQLTTHHLVIGTRLGRTWRTAIGASLSEDLAGIEECQDVVGIRDRRLHLEDDPDHSKFRTAIEYLVTRETIPPQLRLPLYLLHNCYFPRG